MYNTKYVNQRTKPKEPKVIHYALGTSIKALLCRNGHRKSLYLKELYFGIIQRASIPKINLFKYVVYQYYQI